MQENLYLDKINLFLLRGFKVVRIVNKELDFERYYAYTSFEPPGLHNFEIILTGRDITSLLKDTDLQSNLRNNEEALISKLEMLSTSTIRFSKEFHYINYINYIPISYR